MTRLGIISGEPIAAFGLAQLVETGTTLRVAGIYDDGAGVDVAAFDLLVVRLPADPTPTLLDFVLRAARRTTVLVVSADRDPAHTGTLLRGGVNGVLPPGTPLDRVVAALHTVAAGGRVAATTLPVGGDTIAVPSNGLSGRERDVLALIGQGYTHGQVARRLAISSHTVDTYVKRVRAKLRLGNKAELTRAALAYASPVSAGPRLSGHPDRACSGSRS